MPVSGRNGSSDLTGSQFVAWVLWPFASGLLLSGSGKSGVAIFCQSLGLILFKADAQLAKKGKGKPGEKLEKAADTLMGCFRVCAADR